MPDFVCKLYKLMFLDNYNISFITINSIFFSFFVKLINSIYNLFITNKTVDYYQG